MQGLGERVEHALLHLIDRPLVSRRAQASLSELERVRVQVEEGEVLRLCELRRGLCGKVARSADSYVEVGILADVEEGEEYRFRWAAPDEEVADAVQTKEPGCVMRCNCERLSERAYRPVFRVGACLWALALFAGPFFQTHRFLHSMLDQ